MSLPWVGLPQSEDCDSKLLYARYNYCIQLNQPRKSVQPGRKPEIVEESIMGVTCLN